MPSPSSLHHPIFARFYAWVSPSMDAGGVVERRQQLLSGLGGMVIEVGAGNGLNFAHYPREVTRVLAVEPESHLRSVAERNARDARVHVDVVDGVAEQLPVADASFDAAVASLMLCSVADQDAVLRELFRVVKPAGQLRFLEHIAAATPRLRRAQRWLDATVWPTLMGGCHMSRDTAAAVSNTGFHVVELERFSIPEGRIVLPPSPHIIGMAIRP